MIDYDKVFEQMDEQETTTSEEISPVCTEISPLPEWKAIDPFCTKVVASKLGVDKVEEVVQKAEGFVVVSDLSARYGLSVALEARQMGKDIAKARKSITAPYTAFNKECIAKEKEYTERLLKIENELLDKIDEYQAHRKKTLEENGIVDDSAQAISIPEGSCTEKRYFESTIVDISQVPREYLQLNQKAVKDAIDSGVRNIPGINIHEVIKKQYRIRGKK